MMNGSDSKPIPLIIDVQDLSKSFNEKVAVDHVAVRVREGEIFGFLGPNGSGKTTTIRMLCGLLTPDSGTGQCLGFDVISQSSEIKKHIGYMTQKFSLYEDLSVRENLDFIARMYDVAHRKEAVEKALRFLGLDSKYENTLAGTLSGGWKQRLALSAAIVHSPKLLLLDEPTTGIDPKARRKFWDEIHRLASLGVTTLVSTQYMDEAQRCHRLAYISRGKILTEGNVDEMIDQSGLYTWTIVGDDLEALTNELREVEDLQQVTNYGKEVHVSGTNKKNIDKYLAALAQKNYHITSIRPSLEDVFIQFTDNDQAQASKSL